MNLSDRIADVRRKAVAWNKAVSVTQHMIANAEFTEAASPDLIIQMADRIEELEKLVRNAYREGFTEGMREHTSSKGGKTWSESAASRALNGEKL